MGVKCFLITGTGVFRQHLRRYSSEHSVPCPAMPGKYSYHNADGLELPRITLKLEPDPEDGALCYELNPTPLPPPGDPRWPAKCDKCAYAFKGDDEYQIFEDEVYVDAAGKEFSLREPVAGMMWDAWWFGDDMKGPDGKCLVAVTPDLWEWMIDGPCSNCTMPTDRGPFATAHRCWVRHGAPPDLIVDKNGRTCAAGAGSIQTNHAYHGFLGCNGANPGYFT